MGLLADVANIEGGPVTGVKYDPIDDELLIVEQQDVEPIIQHNKELFNDGTDGYGETREWRRIATIPNILLEKWWREEGIRFWDPADTHKLAAKLDDPEFRHLRTAPGKVSRRPVRTYCKASTA